MSDRDWHALDTRLDEAIDALNDERAPDLREDDDPELSSLVDTLRIARRLREPAEPDDAYPADLAVHLAHELTQPLLPELVILPNGHIASADPPVQLPRRRVRMLIWQIAAVLRVLGVGVLAGMITGVIVGGVGGRIVMRVSGMLYEREHPGVVAITESSGQAVGSFSVSGTIGLLMEGMFYGIAGGVFYMILEPWLPRDARRRGAVYGLLILAIFGTVVAITSDNGDFERLGSPALNVLMFAFLFVLFGLVIVPLAERLNHFFPRPGPNPSSSKRRLAASIAVVLAGLSVMPMLVLGLGAGVVMSVGSLAAAGSAVAGERTDGILADLAIALMFLGLGVIVPVLRVLRIQGEMVAVPRAGGRFGRVVARARSRQADTLVYVVLILATLVGVMFLLREVLAILDVTS